VRRGTRTVIRAARLAHHAGLRFLLDELNSVTCGGLRGVSDTFATALWAPDAMFELLRNGVDAVNLHIRATAINAPFSFSSSGLEARPLLYGLILFTRTLGPDARLVGVRLQSHTSLHLKVWAVRVLGGVLHVLVINKGTHVVIIRLHLPASGPASVERMLARSAAATSGVTLGGQYLGLDAGWHGPDTAQTIARADGGYRMAIPALSAALVAVHVA
jgi:hypothetical protein